MIKTTLLAAGLLAALAAPAGAETVTRQHVGGGFVAVDDVNTRNGNFSLTYAAFDQGKGVPFRRTYNSLATNQGVFGKGWGSSFDTKLVPLAADRVVVVENGNGALTAYGAPAAQSPAELEKAVIAARKSGPPPAPNLFQRAWIRVSRWAGGKPAGTRLAIDRRTAFVGHGCNEAAVMREPAAYHRVTCDATVHDFDARGDLKGFSQAGVGKADLTWTGSALTRVATDRGRALAFEHGKSQLKVVDETGGWTTYAFDDRGRNVRMTNAAGVDYAYAYDDRGNLTDIAFVDTTHRRMTYDAQDRVTRILGRNGEVTTFAYRASASGGAETEVTRVSSQGQSATTIYTFD